ncbi:hypothetical protein D3C77_419630 [compost metagenome]|jgi:hypothetical protein|nr:hypothetical protein [Pseudomonas sp.]
MTFDESDDVSLKPSLRVNPSKVFVPQWQGTVLRLVVHRFFPAVLAYRLKQWRYKQQKK